MSDQDPAQIDQTTDFMWKATAAVATLASGFVAEKVVALGWRAIRLVARGGATVDRGRLLRRHVTLTAAEAAGVATLHVGLVDDCDETFVNGLAVGHTCGWDRPRAYAVPAGLLRAGANWIAVRVTDTGGGGGIHGDAAALRLDTAAGAVPPEPSTAARCGAST